MLNIIDGDINLEIYKTKEGVLNNGRNKGRGHESPLHDGLFF